MKKYLSVTVERPNGTKFENPLKLSEVGLISKMAQENTRLTVSIAECSPAHFKYLFG